MQVQNEPVSTREGQSNRIWKILENLTLLL